MLLQEETDNTGAKFVSPQIDSVEKRMEKIIGILLA